MVAVISSFGVFGFELVDAYVLMCIYADVHIGVDSSVDLFMTFLLAFPQRFQWFLVPVPWFVTVSHE